MRLSGILDDVATTNPFTAETLDGDLARGRFPDVRFAMLEFVGQYLLDFERAAQAAGLTLAQARVLGYAAVAPSSMGEIADQFGCDPSNITAKVDRLVELGLVERRPSPEDGRIKLIAATEKGIKKSSDLCHSRTWLAQVLGRLDDGEIDTVRRALDLLVDAQP
jgi:DNA-binding MarR family transcriptional regulator